MPSLNSLLTFLSVVVLLVASIAFGLMKMPTEMGLSILAGALGLAFSNIDKISEFSGAGFSAKMKSQVQAIIDKETEQSSPQAEVEEVASTNVSGNAQKVVNALHHPQYTWRSIPGLIKDSGLTKKELGKELGWLRDNNYVEHSFGKPGSIYTLTAEGRQLSAILDFSNIKNA